MKYVDEFRTLPRVKKLAQAIQRLARDRAFTFMEVCGSHTHSFARFGLKKLIPPAVRLISGPGCPVCVSDQEYIDTAIWYAQQPDTVITTFGDMIRVPGTRSSLEEERSAGADVRIVYSPEDAVTVAAENPGKKIIFLAVGFETTAPAIALSILKARQEKCANIFFFTALKKIIPGMMFIMRKKQVRLDGFLCPGHVSAIIGVDVYKNLAEKHHISCCVAGFEPTDILEGIYMLLQQALAKKPTVTNQYGRVVVAGGNNRAQRIIEEVFFPSDESWRGLGTIRRSGLRIRPAFAGFDACKKIKPPPQKKFLPALQRQCRCGDVLAGLLRPPECSLFARRCTPDKPVGPCMISAEGACHASYRFEQQCR
ncbi:MAG TPA: hydrogenase formation protein HypD [Candidatus Omnitrophota bacterium]|nr:hydrogenase formation protein HypD [Candidatus Omnitrophota bacterium]HPT06996.1 hydrogenase formation protein HypD [Candidatus Omnitrophota bacterium]